MRRAVPAWDATREPAESPIQPHRASRLEIASNPDYPDYEKRGRLDLWHDEADFAFRASRPMTVSDETQDTPLTDETAVLDSGANNLVAYTLTGEQYLYEGRELFQRSRDDAKNRPVTVHVT